MNNVIVAITLPAGFKLMSGATLKQDYSWELISRLAPYYTSVDMVRLTMGPLGAKLRDITVACDIYQHSGEVDIFTPTSGPPNPQAVKAYQRFVGARQRWVTCASALELLLNVHTIYGNPGTKTLANFSVAREGSDDRTGFGTRIKELKDAMAGFETVIRSGGQYAPGEHVSPAMAAKGVLDWAERTPGRTWANTGYGANRQSIDFGSSTGGRGKPVSFYIAPYYSPVIMGGRWGMYNSGYPLSISYPQMPTVRF